jgi:hypothetical protein
MDRFREEQIDHTLGVPLAARLEQALLVMRDGILLQRSKLAAAHPEWTSDDVERALLRWLARE